MRTVVDIWGFSDLTWRDYVFEKEIEINPWEDIQEIVVHLVNELNQWNSLIL